MRQCCRPRRQSRSAHPSRRCRYPCGRPKKIHTAESKRHIAENIFFFTVALSFLKRYSLNPNGFCRVTAYGEYNTVKLGFTVGVLKAHRQIGFHLFYRKLGGNAQYGHFRPGHAYICYISRTVRQYLLVCRGHMGVSSKYSRSPSVKIKAHSALFGSPPLHGNRQLLYRFLFSASPIHGLYI